MTVDPRTNNVTDLTADKILASLTEAGLLKYTPAPKAVFTAKQVEAFNTAAEAGDNTCWETHQVLHSATVDDFTYTGGYRYAEEAEYWVAAHPGGNYTTNDSHSHGFNYGDTHVSADDAVLDLYTRLRAAVADLPQHLTHLADEATHYGEPLRAEDLNIHAANLAAHFDVTHLEARMAIRAHLDGDPTPLADMVTTAAVTITPATD